MPIHLTFDALDRLGPRDDKFTLAEFKDAMRAELKKFNLDGKDREFPGKSFSITDGKDVNEGSLGKDGVDELKPFMEHAVYGSSLPSPRSFNLPSLSALPFAYRFDVDTYIDRLFVQMGGKEKKYNEKDDDLWLTKAQVQAYIKKANPETSKNFWLSMS